MKKGRPARGGFRGFVVALSRHDPMKGVVAWYTPICCWRCRWSVSWECDENMSGECGHSKFGSMVVSTGSTPGGGWRVLHKLHRVVN